MQGFIYRLHYRSLNMFTERASWEFTEFDVVEVLTVLDFHLTIHCSEHFFCYELREVEATNRIYNSKF